MITLKLTLVLTLTEYFNWFLEKINVSYSSDTLSTFRFYAIIGVFFLATYMKFYKEKYVVKSGSELDHLF
jgi:hypothetical protein